MENGQRVKKGQTGIYLSVIGKNLLRVIAKSMGLTMSTALEVAIREYAFNHRDELQYLATLSGEQKARKVLSSDN